MLVLDQPRPLDTARGGRHLVRDLAIVMVTAALVVLAPYADAAAKKPRKPVKPSGPVPGSVLITMNGSFAYAFPRITQNVWQQQKCASTAVGPYDANNLSASVVPIAKWAGDQMSATFTPQGQLPTNTYTFSIAFYDRACVALDVNDGKAAFGQWNAQLGAAKQAGMIPTGAAYALVQGASNSAQYLTPPQPVGWQLVVRVPLRTDPKPTPMTVADSIPA